MDQPDRSVRELSGCHAADAPVDADPAEEAEGGEGVDIQAAVAWIRQRHVTLLALALIVAQLIWKAHFLSHLYLVQDDFYNLDHAIESSFSWRYLTFIGVSHLMIGARALAWLLARVSLYDWGLMTVVNLAFLAAASLAALRLLRTLFGERLVILLPLGFYLLCPLTLPDLGWWSAAMESVPLQLAIFAALTAHVLYVRTGRVWHLVAAAGWLVFGLLFFEKALVLPLLLFAVTAAFLVGRTSWLAGAKLALTRYWRAWAVYAALAAVHAVVLVLALPTSTVQPHAPPSAGAVLTFAWGTVKDTLVPGALGGPWQWYPVTDVSLAAAPTALTWLALLAAAVVIVASIWRRKTAWRSWAILAGWVVAADMVPVIIGRLNFYPILRALDAHYLADAVPILAICLGLAFLPVTDALGGVPAAEATWRARPPAWEQGWQLVATALAGVFVFGSVWSAAAYVNVTNFGQNRAYVANITQAVDLAPAGTNMVDWPVPPEIANPYLGKYAWASTMIGDLERGVTPRKLHWLGIRPHGTFDGLMMFGPDGRMYPLQVPGVSAARRPTGHGCWPERNGVVVVSFPAPAPGDTWELRIGYYWPSPVPGQVTVQYGGRVQELAVRPGLNAGYLPVTGTVRSFVVSGLGAVAMCIGDAEAGVLAPDLAAAAIPAVPAVP